MKRLLSLLLLVFCVQLAAEEAELPKRYKVGLCVMATGRYDVYAQSLIESARPNFLAKHDVTYFIFTDGSNIKEAKDVVKVFQKRLGWPHDTLKRFHVYNQHKEIFKDMDYVFATDADMQFVSPVGDEILSDLVGTIHPGFVGGPGPYAKNKKSAAYISKKEGTRYFAGGFYGGKREQFIKLVSKTAQQVDQDLKWDYIARWHDESHLNRYFVDNPPSLALSPAYCYPENWIYDTKLVARNKNHTEMRK
jgi:histo-blood group ABO system transferase